MGAITRLRDFVRRIKHDAVTVYFIARDPRTSLVVRLFALFIAAYALSPIDLIPDFIPVLGLLDDAILLPAGIALIIKLTPAEVIQACQARARNVSQKPNSTVAAVVIVAIWIFCAALFGLWMLDKKSSGGSTGPKEITEGQVQHVAPLHRLA